MLKWLSSINQQTSVGKNLEKKNIRTLWVGMQISAATVENSMEFLKKLKMELPYIPSNSTSSYISKETQNTNLKEHMHPYVHYSTIHNSQAMEATQVPINR